MKLKKLVLFAAMTAAIGSVNVFGALADAKVVDPNAEETTVEAEAEAEEVKSGWLEEGGYWHYYKDGSMISGWIKGDDGRGTEIWYYIDPATNNMLANETRVIGDVSYTFSEDGSWVAPVVQAPKGKVSGGSYTNTVFNIKIPQIMGQTNTEYEGEELYAGEDYAAIGRPTLTYDLVMSSDSFGDLEIYYADMTNKSDMDATAFVTALVEIEKGKYGVITPAENVTVGGQVYAKASITTNNPNRRNQTENSYYCRKQGNYMIIIHTYGTALEAGARESVVNTITTAQ